MSSRSEPKQVCAFRHRQITSELLRDVLENLPAGITWAIVVVEEKKKVKRTKACASLTLWLFHFVLVPFPP